MNEVSMFRLYLLRAVYLIIGMGLAIQMWPRVIHHDKPWELMHGVVICMLAALGALALLGLRYPLRMLPVLLWEMLWKSIWLLAVALPAWTSGHMDQATWETTFACLMAVIVPIAMPWRYVFANYVLRPGDPWMARTKRHRAAST
jgi:hypothetical protein